MFRSDLANGTRRPRKKTSLKRRSILDPCSLPGARPAPQPITFSPQLATLGKEVPEGDSWIHEIKYDGYRMLCFLENGKVRIVSRNGLDWTPRFKRIAEAAASLQITKGILDGEIVVFREDGTSDFNALQNYVEGRPATLTYVVYDIPHCQGYDLTRTPLIERKRFLEKLLKDRSGGEKLLIYSEHVQGNGEAFFKAAGEHDLEGIVSKKATSGYFQGRTRSWLKLKFTKSDEFLVLGFTKIRGGDSAGLSWDISTGKTDSSTQEGLGPVLMTDRLRGLVGSWRASGKRNRPFGSCRISQERRRSFGSDRSWLRRSTIAPGRRMDCQDIRLSRD